MKCGFKSMIIGKFGDFFFMVFIAWCFRDLASLSFYFLVNFVLDCVSLFSLSWCVLFSAFSKSTQFGLHI